MTHPAWVRDIRERGEASFKALPLPSRKNENYRYTSVASIEKSLDFKVQRTQPKSGEPLHAKTESGRAFLTPGSSHVALSKGAEDVGVVFVDWNSALDDHRSLLESHLAPPESLKEDFFSILASARWQNGILLFVPDGVKLENPFHVVYEFDSENRRYLGRVLVLGGKGAKFTFVEEFRGEGELFCNLSEFNLKDECEADLVQIQNFKSAEYFPRREIVLRRNTNARDWIVSLGGSKGQVRSESRFESRGASLKIMGAACGQDDQHMDHWYCTRHETPENQSDLKFWTMMDDRARSVFNGNIIIDESAAQTEAHQKNQNLLLSQKAEIDTIPKLEIGTDDVKCSHGASISSVNEDQLYYLRSRGIEQDEAEKMIVSGFTEPVIESLPVESLKVQVHRLLSEKWGALQ